MLGLLVALAISGDNFSLDRIPAHSQPADSHVASAAEASHLIRGKKFSDVTKTASEIFRKDGNYISLSDLPVLVGKYFFVDNRLCIELRHGVRSCRYILISKDGRVFGRYRKGPIVEMISLGEVE